MDLCISKYIYLYDYVYLMKYFPTTCEGKEINMNYIAKSAWDVIYCAKFQIA